MNTRNPGRRTLPGAGRYPCSTLLYHWPARVYGAGMASTSDSLRAALDDLRQARREAYQKLAEIQAQQRATAGGLLDEAVQRGAYPPAPAPAPAPDPVPVGSRWRWREGPAHGVFTVAKNNGGDRIWAVYDDDGSAWPRIADVLANATRIDVPEAPPPAACCGTCRGRRCEPGWNRCEVCGHLCPVTVPEAPVVERDAKPETPHQGLDRLRALAALARVPDVPCDDNDEALGAEAACKPGCTPAAPCMAANCPAREEEDVARWMVECGHVSDRDDLRAFTRAIDRWGAMWALGRRPDVPAYEPSPSGLGALACPTMGPGR